MENGTVVICLLIGMLIGYLILKSLATKYFIKLYRETGKNMITRPRQLLGFIAGLAMLFGLVAISTDDIFDSAPLKTALISILVPIVIAAIMYLTNRSVGNKRAIFCTAYQLALGICFVGRLLVWIVEISFEIGGMICFGDTARFTWHPFFLTIINKDGSVSEKKSANVVMNEDGAFEGGFKTATKIEAQMNNTRVATEQSFIEDEIRCEAINRDQAIYEGGEGVDEQQRIDELQKQYNDLDAQKRVNNQ